MSTPQFRAMTLLPLLLAALAGCAEDASFPSLAPRAVERLSNEEPVRAPVQVAADPELSGRIAELEGKARRGNNGFTTALPAARAVIDRAGAAGSDSWIEAQEALSGLEAARAETLLALAALDGLSVERATLPTNAGQFQALLAAFDAARLLAAEQQSEIDRLRRSLSPI